MLFDSTNNRQSGIHELFEAQVTASPSDAALIFEDLELTYSTLNCLSNQLARHLRSLGIGKDSKVGICMRRSPEMIVSILAIWKAGGAYLPLDSDYPLDRLKFMIEDSAINCLLTHSSAEITTRPILRHYEGSVLIWENIQEELSRYQTSNLSLPTQGSELSYIIYTSGSTGKPKGVMIEHKNAINLAHALQDFIDVKPGARVLQFASISFDASVLELILSLTTGGVLVLASKENLMLGLALTTTINRYNINITLLSPTALNQMDPEQLPSLQTVLSGGEALLLSIATTWSKSKNLINAYGPTEITVCATVGKVQAGTDRVTIGKPLPNYRAYILDAQGNQLPVGTPGELCIGGAGVGRGYLNQPELTAEKFVADPFNPGLRMYRSGDLARWLPTGDIEYLGRIDQQVKIRGFRIELGEIESALLSDNAISEAAVTVRQDHQGENYLCAYYVADREKTVQELRCFLGQSLPEFMIPARFVPIDKLPLTPNGKVDRKALPDPGDEIHTGKEFTPPSTDQEKIIVKIWSKILGINAEQIGIEDEFFTLGGNSLKAIALSHEIHKNFHKQVPIQIIFQKPTIKALSAYLDQEKDGLDQESPHLIPLQPNGSQQPIFIAPGIEGKCFYLVELANALGKDQPVYGFQSVGLVAGEEPFGSIEEIAAFNISLIRKIQPKGPYLLAGHSMGGWVIIEMANQLLRQGETISFLGLLDSYSPSAIDDLGGYMQYSKEQDINDLLMLMERLVAYFNPDIDYQILKIQLEQIDSQKRLSLVHHWSVLKGLIPESFSKEELGKWANLIGTNSRMDYSPSEINQTTLLFKAESNRLDNKSISKCLGWSNTAGLNLKIKDTPGDHFSMMHDPHVHSLANTLLECINKPNGKLSTTNLEKSNRAIEALEG